VTGQELTAMERVWAFGDLASTPLIIVGAFATVLVGLPGAVVMLAGLAVALSTHLIVGVVEYRRVMAREWPKVRALDEEDEW
jgi:hypothetical protein